MAFTLEDGTGISNANAYVSVAFADGYHDDRGRQASWTNQDNLKKQEAIVRATDHIERVYGHRFKGRRTSSSQALAWPRIGAYDGDNRHLDAVPAALQKACAEYAIRALQLHELTPDAPSPVPAQDLSVAGTGQTSASETPAGAVVREKIGPIETEFAEPARVNSDTVLPMYPAADRYLTELLKSKNVRDIARS